MKTRRVKCRCVTRWLVDFADDRGEVPVSAMVAALASGVGLRVRLAAVSSSPVRLVGVPGIIYSGAKTYVKENCPTCGWPVLLGIVERKAVTA